ncbi:LysR substrate-binding domain-containing protein [Phenylobacterium aquaticum]|uniref:LysR substrate-binding domain-containing protein n=1 Tax=Phenylobacterium aquaticum TaxID=1763816 RepID=UPI0026F31181|nr:LysR substrate-binding domain-containing protein [Phenylobacterium aquaticum]
MAVNLPTELLRSFAAIVDSGSMLRATERVFVTQSALSLQMKRLEETVQTPLFHRDGRRLVLTPTGETLLAFARDILAMNDRAVAAVTGDALAGPARVGLVQDFAETLLSGVLSQFAQLNPDAQLQIRVGGSQELIDLLNTDRLDIVLCMGASDDQAAIRTAPTIWLGDDALLAQEVLPIAVLERPCRFRDAALSALDASGRPYRVVLETPSLSVLRAAVNSGLGITCRTELFSTRRLGEAEAASLPDLPGVAYVRHVRAKPHPTIARLAELIRTAVLDLQTPAAA